MDEFALIRMLNRSRATGIPDDTKSGVAVGIGDDAAVLRPAGGKELIVSCDTMVESVHFKPETMTYADIGYKAMASSLSDLAAMGAEPRWALIALAAPRTSSAEELRELYDGLYACAEQYGTAIVGGDTTSSPSGLTVTVTVIGEAAAEGALLRSAAKPGDAVFVTGPLGGSAAGLHALLERGGRAGPLHELPESIRPLAKAHRLPEPRIDAGRILAAAGTRVCGALNDISDGLASEAWEIAEASGVHIVLFGDRIPQSDELRDYAAAVKADPLDFALYGGEDYELVGTVRQGKADELAALFERAGKRIWIVGEVAEPMTDGEGTGVTLARSGGESGTPVGKKGYNHFA
ncbi:thiamine-phosphate kinase [Paenibacillus mesophilus]|uniref:thiamine-phosphate kinase n=1 Tax=Paenibacillus mesophilus TaxID=2582849 RepID=UPI00110EC138|nr:thiamine-phosphate kinase [Paenibacillus mesophilus]TMV50998.1 thiamine-phosphate kinase [Paenibacillus mesophilus]